MRQKIRNQQRQRLRTVYDVLNGARLIEATVNSTIQRKDANMPLPTVILIGFIVAVTIINFSIWLRFVRKNPPNPPHKMPNL